ncbi:hypothetical protein [Streptomyces inhibens]|uniref:hypothetical protein n=1 Tax=Streptomyces inhibens TaxID=2293571 RepID=UPI001EE6948D|nr:hypothetical protein [Streptomyces inhibens]UKY50883.1 hypothetical protein KI385_20045 [Streptomyces inhibens]
MKTAKAMSAQSRAQVAGATRVVALAKLLDDQPCIVSELTKLLGEMDSERKELKASEAVVRNSWESSLTAMGRAHREKQGRNIHCFHPHPRFSPPPPFGRWVAGVVVWFAATRELKYPEDRELRWGRPWGGARQDHEAKYPKAAS